MHNYDTVSEALKDLKARGFTKDFNIAYDKLICGDESIALHPDDFEIVEVYRFEGDTNPSDEDVVYAVESKDGKTKGVISSAYGTYAEEISTELLKKLTIVHEQ
ncbi:MAG: phosphoribosylpyrophosphate synthetase [Ferruginibacter sp.]